MSKSLAMVLAGTLIAGVMQAAVTSPSPAIIAAQCTGYTSSQAGYSQFGIFPGLGNSNAVPTGGCFTGVYVGMPQAYLYLNPLLMPSGGVLKNLRLSGILTSVAGGLRGAISDIRVGLGEFSLDADGMHDTVCLHRADGCLQ